MALIQITLKFRMTLITILIGWINNKLYALCGQLLVRDLPIDVIAKRRVGNGAAHQKHLPDNTLHRIKTWPSQQYVAI